jgi:hypothetical protein
MEMSCALCDCGDAFFPREGGKTAETKKIKINTQNTSAACCFDGFLWVRLNVNVPACVCKNTFSLSLFLCVLFVTHSLSVFKRLFHDRRLWRI